MFELAGWFVSLFRRLFRCEYSSYPNLALVAFNLSKSKNYEFVECLDEFQIFAFGSKSRNLFVQAWFKSAARASHAMENSI